MDKITQGVPIEETGVTGTTNGASMKTAPIGIISDYQDLPTLVKNVAEICLPTHNTTITIAGASAVAAAICGGMNPKMPREMIRQIEEVNQLDFDQLAEELLPFVKEAK